MNLNNGNMNGNKSLMNIDPIGRILNDFGTVAMTKFVYFVLY